MIFQETLLSKLCQSATAIEALFFKSKGPTYLVASETLTVKKAAKTRTTENCSAISIREVHNHLFVPSQQLIKEGLQFSAVEHQANVNTQTNTEYLSIKMDISAGDTDQSTILQYTTLGCLIPKTQTDPWSNIFQSVGEESFSSHQPMRGFPLSAQKMHASVFQFGSHKKKEPIKVISSKFVMIED